MNKRPNIVYIFTDQQFAGAMSCAGNRDLQTPAMDRIAANGVLFRNAYCAYPLCTPSRAAMFTGMLPHESGVDKNNLSLSPEQASGSLGAVLGKAGYHTIYHGKWHIPGYNITDDQGFEETGFFGDACLAENCIKSIASAPVDKPYFLVASFDNPHNICEWSRGQNLPWGNVPESPLEECPDLPENLDQPGHPEALAAEQESRPRLFCGARYPDLYWRYYRQVYYNLVEKVDTEIGKILDVLDENTLVIFSSDHGDGIGAHRWNQKWALYEESVKVPFIVSDPDSTRRGEQDDALIAACTDLFPTICDYAGASIPEGLRGKSLRPRIQDVTAPDPHELLVVETLFEREDSQPWTEGRALRTRRYKYILYSWGRGREQLFDMQEDPLEKRNLALDGSCAEILDEHRRRLIEWCDATNDGRFRRKCCIAPGEIRARDRL